MSPAGTEPLVVNGWKIFAHSLFLNQLEALVDQVEDLRDKLTEEEIAQAEVWFKEKVNKTKEWSRAHNIRYAHQKLEELAAAIKEQPELVTLEVAAKTYKGIDLVATALRKAGYKKTQAQGGNKNDQK